ncbi:MAG: DUF87 domain-containing protein [Pseudomonadota bacterium]
MNAVSMPVQGATSRPGIDPGSIGTIRYVNGTAAQIVMESRGAPAPPLGSFVTIYTGHALAIAQVTGMHMPESVNPAWEHPGFIDVELVGELVANSDGHIDYFRRGVSIAPRLGDRAQTISKDELAIVSRTRHGQAIQIGTLHQDPSIPAAIEVDEMLGKHFAIVGSTGSGKSCTVALVLRQVLERHPHAHIVLLDPHNEYTSCFGDQAELVPLSKLTVPYWALTFEELTEIVLGDHESDSQESEALRELIPLAKRRYAMSAEQDPHGAGGVARSRAGRERFSVDVPVPYRMADVMAMIDEEMGRLEKTRDLDVMKRLKSRITAVTQDPRFAFMFGGFAVQDTLKDILKHLFRVPVAGKPITVVGLMGLPGEVINVVVSVLARLAFDLAIYSQGQLPITFVCEEAHRYVPAQSDRGFEPTKRSIARIAKEGRKYGASLCVVSQRPADLDATILSQCSTVFAMRLANERDQGIIASALPDASRPLLRSLPLLGTREAIVFGEGVNLPSRIILDKLPETALPSSSTALFSELWASDQNDDMLLEGVIKQWRYSPDAAKERMSSALDKLQAQQEELTQLSPSAGQMRPMTNGTRQNAWGGQSAQRPAAQPNAAAANAGISNGALTNGAFSSDSEPPKERRYGTYSR